MVNNPLPQSLQKEIENATKIIKDFTMPSATKGPDKMIPRDIFANCKGIAVISVLKAGFLISVRGGSGIVVAKNNRGGWTAPAAIGTTGLGGGLQVGAEITDFVLVLNTNDAVKAFSKGNVTLGGNLSVAVGPLGRNAEAATTLNTVAAVYTYSKTKGLFAGISLEGSGIIQRPDANKKFYGRKLTTKEIFDGAVDPPNEANMLYRVLGDVKYGMLSKSNSSLDSKGGNSSSSRSGSNNNYRGNSDSRSGYDYNRRTSDYANKKPSSGSKGTPRAEAYLSGGSSGTAGGYSSYGGSNDNTYGNSGSSSSYGGYSGAASAAASSYDKYGSSATSSYGNANTNTASSAYNKYGSSATSAYNQYGSNNSSSYDRYSGSSSYSNTASAAPSKYDSYSNTPPPYEASAPAARVPPVPKPRTRPPVPSKPTCRALYDFEAQESGDLGFKQGDTIVITSRTESVDDWWKGELNGRKGNFPANYVELI
eukprot:Nk52_evm9s273 gene=Nk52_evmTU9s273